MKQLPPASPQSDPTAHMGLFEHLHELRKRLLYITAALCVGTVLTFSFSQPLFDLLTAPFYQAFPKDTLIGTGPAEAFMIRIKVAFFSGALVMSPILFLQVWLFIAPGLYPEEKRLALPFVLATTALFLGGVWLCYTQVLPLALEFFNQQYKAIGLTPTIKLSEHLSLMITSLLGFGIVFEFPIVAFILGRLGIIDDQTLIRGFRYAIVAIFVVAAVVTPPDVLSQFLLAGPLCILYGLSIVILRYTAKREQ
jgi:sec-independent protein translocase protein TatC